MYMDFGGFVLLVVTITAALTALLFVHHLLTVRRIRINAELVKAQNKAEWKSCNKVIQEMFKNLPKMMKDAIKEMEELL